MGLSHAKNKSKMPLEVPNEIWTEILKRVMDFRDWGRLQQVSRTFNALIQDHCWTQAKELKLLFCHNNLASASIDRTGLVLLEAKELLFATEVLKKAVKIQAVHLSLADDIVPETAGWMVFQRLVSTSLQIKYLHISLSDPGPMLCVLSADFISSISGTLETLRCTIQGSITSPELHQAFRRCDALQNIIIDRRDRDQLWLRKPALMESILSGKTHLQTVHMWGQVGTPLQTASALLSTGAHLTGCRFEMDLDCGRLSLDAYGQLVHERNLLGDHPLKTLKTLSTGIHPAGSLIPLELFPDLEQLDLFYGSMDCGLWNRVVGQFLAEYKDAPWNRRFLNIQMKDYHVPTMDDILQQMVCPAASIEETEREKELMFVRGNATAKVVLIQLILYRRRFLLAKHPEDVFLGVSAMGEGGSSVLLEG